MFHNGANLEKMEPRNNIKKAVLVTLSELLNETVSKTSITRTVII